MGHIHHKHKPSMATNFANKIKVGAEVIGGIKTAFDIGRTIYQGIQTAAPYIQTAATAARALI